MPSELSLDQRFESKHGSVTYDVFGDGDPVILIHGTPSSSYLWRNVVTALEDDWEVYLHDLVGFGRSEQYEDQDVSLNAHGEVFAELLDHWGLENPNAVGHDFGGTILLRALLLHDATYRGMVIMDAALRSPWVSEFSTLVGEHLDVFRQVPEHIHRHLVAGHIRRAIYHDMSDEALEPYLEPWLGPDGQTAYYRQVSYFDGRYTDEIEDDYPSISTPMLVAWGEHDDWLDIDDGQWFHEQVPGSEFEVIPDAGHFAPEDNPSRVAEVIDEFFKRDL